MIGVANVIMNRAAKPCWWGATVAEVCLKPYQFSCWNKGDPNLPIIENLDDNYQIFNEAMEIARQAVGGSLPDITNGATSYYAASMKIPPAWASGKTPCATIGNQLFFNDDQPEETLPWLAPQN